MNEMGLQSVRNACCWLRLSLKHSHVLSLTFNDQKLENSKHNFPEKTQKLSGNFRGEFVRQSEDKQYVDFFTE